MKTNLLKSIFISLILIVGATNAWGVTFSGGEILVLKPNTNWTKDGARFAAYFFGNGDKWVSMTAVNGLSGYYEVTAPSGGYTKVIFCRMNGGNNTNNWNNKWNQTGDLTYDGKKNVFTVPSGAWDDSTSSWGNIAITVTLDAQSGTGGTASVDVNYGEDERPTFTAPTRTGYDFGGFYTSTGGGGSQVINASNAWQKNISNYVDANGRWIKNAACTLYAKWTEKTYSLTFKHDGHGTIKVGGTIVNSGSTASVNYVTTKPLVATPNTGYNFSNWTLSGSNTGAVTIGSTSTASTTIKATNTGATVTANFTPKTYTITLDKNGGASNGSATATYNSNTIAIASQPTRTDYRCDGYATAASGGTLVLNTNGTLVADVSGYTDANGNWIKDGAATLFAQWTYDVTEYTVTFGVGTGYTSYGSLSAKNNSTSASITSPATVRSGQSITFTATPKTGYEVEGWYTNAACTAGKHNAGNTTYTTSITGATNVYVKFVEKTWSVSFAATTGGTVDPSATQIVGEANGITIIAESAKGYTFAGWTSSNGGSFNDAKAEKTTFYPTAATTVTASFTENLYTITVKSSDNNHGTVTQSTDKAGIVTTIEITATPVLGYRFVNWTATDAGITIANPNSPETTITASTAGTVTANFELIPPTTVYFRPKTDWKNNNPVIICDGNSTAVTPYDCSGDYYTAQVPATTKDLKFGDNGEQTLSLTVPTDGKVLYDMTSTNITHLYLSPGVWDVDGAWFAAYFFEGSKNTWKKMTAVDGSDDLFVCEIPSGYTNVIFARSNPSNTNLDWDKIWNKTGDLKVPTNGTNKFSISGWENNGDWHTTWDDSRWKEFTVPTYSITKPVGTGGIVTVSKESGITLNEQVTVTITASDGYTYKSGTITIGTDAATDLEAGTSTHTICGNAEISVEWNANKYSVKFDANDGEGEMANQDFTYDAAAQALTANAFTREGYAFAGWNTQADGSGISYTNKQSVQNLTTENNGVVTLYAQWEPATYTITWNPNGGEVDPTTSSYTYNGTTVELPNPTRDEFTFVGWFTKQSGGTQITEIGTKNKPTSDVTYYAHWQGAPYTVTLNQEGAATSGTEEVTAYYEGDMPTAGVTMPTAPNGYAFMGYFDQKDGKGTQYYDSIGASAHMWNKTENDTLYAYFKAAEITINLNAASFEPNSATPVIATAALTPKPVGTTSICWELLYNDDTSVAEHAPQETGEPNQVQFNINDLATGTYQIKATLREGAGCTGTIISHATQVFTITSDHTITIRYVDENGQTIKASETQFAHVSSLTEITAPEIIGYTFKEWEAGDGVSIKGATDGKKNTADIEYNAYYDGYLKAIYTKNSNIIYFYNTLGWENVYVYFYSSDKYWDDNKGSGSKKEQNFTNGDDYNHKPHYREYRGTMTHIAGTQIWYYDCSVHDDEIKGYTNVVFNKNKQDGYEWFHKTEVVRRKDMDADKLPMYVPIKAAEVTKNETKYYNKGYWMNYPNHSGYTLDLFNHHSNNDPARYFIYPYSQDTIFPLQIQVDINAENIADDGKKKIWFRIHRNDGKNFGGNANTFPSVKPGTTGGFITENDYKVELITPIAGTYTFILDYKYDETAKDYKYHISVDYPAAVGDYRILYRDAAEKTWSGKDKNKEGDEIKWYHASRVIKKGTDTKDIISFFINKDIRRTLSYQTIEAIDKDGNITWSKTEEQFSNVDWSQIDTSGVYNFVFVQDGKGISVENDIVPYTGNYYIRTDAMDGKWEDYKTNPDNRMFYSAFSESEANSFGDKFSHYATKWCEAGTNVKFTIANDYSHCISDTLAQDIIPLGNLTDEGTLLNNDIYDANIRFMWNRKTNKISREYVGPAGDKQSQFLMLKACEEIQDAEGNKLNPAEGDILDEENDIYAARFTDTQNWIYERTIKVKPGTRVKLYACYPKVYHIYVQNKSNWDQVALYAWKDSDKPLGDWPGTQPFGTVEIGGKTYYDFHVNEYVFGCQLILNNNNQGQQTDGDNAFKLATAAGNYYLIENSKTLTKEKEEVFATESKARYFRGAYAEGSCDNENTVQILGGEGDTWNTIRVIYDFKTNRLMAAWMPDNKIDTVHSIESDVMIIRDHQNPAQCITFANDSSKLTAVKTVYGVMRFNRWILNNRGGADNLDIESCTKVVDNQTVYDNDTTNKYHPILEPAKQTSQYERALYFISFPFDVHLSDVFGFGTYGQHWIIEYYDGLKRAKEGYWIDSDPNWKYVTDPANFVLEKYKGYILCLNLGKMAYDNTDFWAHNISQVELFFPSTTTMEEIAKAEVTMPKLGEEYLCKINRGDGTEGDRRVKDSYWRCIGVPSYANYSNVLKDEEGDPIQWQTSYKTFPFLYKWNKTDNTLTPQSTTNFKFETMHAYLVQNGGEIHWSAVNATPDKPNAGIIAKVKETTRNYEWRITLTQGEKEHDQAFVRLSDNEKVTTEFDFNQDLSKEFNYGRSDIYTLIGYEKAAANSLPLSEQTTVIPLGLSIEYNGDYTLAMPDRVNGIGVTLVDNQTGTRTNLSAGMDYTLTLNKGDYNNRFFIEISPVQQVPTDIEYVTGDSNSQDNVRKVLIDNILYIVRDGQMFDARGARVK